MSSALVYLSGMNLFTLSDMHKPLYPELTSRQGSLDETANVTQEYYFEKAISLGVKVTF